MRYVIVLGWLLLSLGATASPIESLARLLNRIERFQQISTKYVRFKRCLDYQDDGCACYRLDLIFYWKTNPPFSQVIVADGSALGI